MVVEGGREDEDPIWVQLPTVKESISTAADVSGRVAAGQLDQSYPAARVKGSTTTHKSSIPITGVNIQVPRLPADAELSVREFFQSEKIALNQRLKAKNMKK